jgi:RHS repeat-associated protein
MRIKCSIICLLFSIITVNAQYQNYMLNTPDDGSKVYIGRDYVRLLPGYSFKASADNQMNAKIDTGLTSAKIKTFLSAANPTGDVNINVAALTAINTNLAVGQIPISSSVSQNGARCYNVPIEIIPGRQSFQPNLSLSYNSQLGNGVVGMGWNIDGLSSIESVSKNIYFDGTNDIPDLLASGEYALDGIRLVKIQTNQVGNGTFAIDYETVTGYIKVKAYSKNGVIISFTVWYPNGRVGIYSNLNGVAPTLNYPITSLSDVNENIIEFSYARDNVGFLRGTSNEAYYVDEINYGKCGDKAHFAKVKFEYESRPDSIFEVQSTKTWFFRKRLRKIKTLVNSELVRVYDLKYSNSEYKIWSNLNIGTSRLTEIGCSAGGNSLNPIKLFYGESLSNSVIRKVTHFPGTDFDLTKINVLRGQFDSDGQNDALLIYPKGEVYNFVDGEYKLAYPALNKIKLFKNKDGAIANVSNPIDAGVGFEGVLLANIDNDRSDEIVKINSHFTGSSDPLNPYATALEYVTFSTYEVLDDSVILTGTKEYPFGLPSFKIIRDGTGSNADSYKPFTTPRRYYIGNFTGNGKSEVLSTPVINIPYWSDCEYNQKIYLVDLSKNEALPTDCGCPFVLKSDLVYTLDIDGDGQTELVVVRDDHTDVYKFKKDNGFVDIGDWDLKLSDFDERQVMFADLNGDGNIDIIQSSQQPDKLKAPSWFNGLRAYGHYMKCPNPKCNYIHVAVSKKPNGGIIETKYIAQYKGVYRDYYDPKQKPDRINLVWPRKISSTMAETYCPGCQQHLTYPIEEWDERHCWECGRTLDSRGYCSKHNLLIDHSQWTSELRIGTTHFDWKYQYTDGKSIVLSETRNSISREYDSKFSIHEANGDGTPDLFVQFCDGSTIIYPFILPYRQFTYLPADVTLANLPQKYEYIDYDLNSGHSYTSLLALGASNIISYKLPFNQTRSTMISLMVNSLGVVEKTDYSQLYDSLNYTVGTTAQFPYTDFVSPMWIVSNHWKMYDKKVIENINYKYQGAILHNQGLGFLGFSSISSVDQLSNKLTTTEYDPYKLGAVTKQRSEEGESHYEYNFTVSPIKKMRLLLTSKTIKDNLKGNTIQVTYPLQDYDACGNPGREITDYGDGIKSTVVKNYGNKIISTGNSTTRMFIGMLTNKNVTSERDGKSFVRSEDYMYSRGQLIIKQEYLGSKLVTKTEYIYDPVYRGNILSEIHYNAFSRENLTTSYTYWDDDQCSLKSITDPFGRVSTYTYDFNKRLLTGVKDYRSNNTIYGYDNDWRRLNKITRPDGTTTDITLNWNSGSSSRLFLKETKTTTGQPIIAKYTDAFGRETRTSVSGLDGGEIYTDKNYDSFGRLLSSSMPYKVGQSPFLTNYSYDAYDRIENIASSNGTNTSYTYRGNQVIVNKDGVVTKTTTDPIGNIVSSTDDGGTVNYVYRADGQPESINVAGVQTSFEYNDDYNRQTKLIDPSAGIISTTYDDANRKVTQTWNSGKQITVTVNKYGQPISKTTPDFVTSYGYENGQLKSITTNNGCSKEVEYDGLGRIRKYQEVNNGKTYDEEYSYNETGQLKSIYYSPLSFTVNYQYRNGYLYKLEDASGNRLREVNSVNSLGMETKVLLGNGLTTQIGYTPEGQWTNVQTSNLATSASPIQDMSFDFNRKDGTLNSRSDLTRGLTEAFTYGALLRLKTYGIPTSPQAVAYKANGNIETKSDVGSYSYGNAYTLSSVNTASDLTNELTVDYTLMSRPASISTENGLLATFSYNDDYDRTYMQLKQDGIETMSRYYFGGGRYEIETVGGVEKQRLYLDGSPYNASVVAEKTSEGTKLYYLHRDYLGSLTQISDNLGNLTAEYSYDAWGRMRNVNNWNVYGSGSQPELKFGRGYTGHEHLNQFGLINMNARLYDPLLGRFLAPDAQVSSPEMSNAYNRYIYAYNNPLMYVDLDGEAGDYPGAINNSNPYGSGTINYTTNPSWNGYGGNYYYGGGSGSDYGYSSVGYSVNGNSGYTSAENWGGLIVSGLQWLFGSHRSGQGDRRPRDYSKVVVTPSNANTTLMKRPIGVGASTVYSGGKNRLGTNNPSGQGDMPGWASDVNTGINALGVANSAKTELIDYAVRSNYKSARTWSEFNNLRSSQQAWRTTNTLGKTGASYLKYAKGLGYVGAGLTTTYLAANAGMYYYNGGTDWQVGTKATLDVIMTGVGFLGPIGFGISASYFILDATTGGFGGFGQIKP